MVFGGGTSQWDTCAPEAILREAGGRITDMFGKPLEYNVADARNLHGLVASNSMIHDGVIEAVKATR